MTTVICLVQAELELDKALSDGQDARARAEKHRKAAEEMQRNITQLVTYHAGEVLGAQLSEQVKLAVDTAEVGEPQRPGYHRRHYTDAVWRRAVRLPSPKSRLRARTLRI